MLIKSLYLPIIGLSALIMVSCGQINKQEVKEEIIEHEHAEEIVLTERQMQAVNIQFGEVEQRELNSFVRVNGEMNLDPQFKADVNSLTGGIIRQINVTEGKNVVKGQVVAYLENTEIVELQKDYLIVKKETLIAQQEYKRQKELFAQGAGVEKTLQQASANYEILEARRIGLEKQLQQLSINFEQVSAENFVSLIPIKAPITGAVHKININIGSYVDIQTPLMSILDNSNLHCDLKVFEKDIHLIKIGQEVDIVLSNQAGTSLKGEIYELNQSFENETKAITIHATIKNKKGLTLMQGMYVTALINTGIHKTDAVPNDAIVSIEGKKYIFVLKDEIENKEEKIFHLKSTEVITGISELGFTQISPINELPKDAKIIKYNAFYIASMLAGGEEED
ncbi:MAG: efflux RND transporter periplasmic adaptor subunit [Bacteroidales bacterium]|jgi:cobalt-zinc-cadmium efflux system membrane fusion protein|nr:efflux RND transporter periplasmic adaptor subunit [Bacteroidales bacterium]